MKKWGFLLFLIVCFGLAFVNFTSYNEPKVEIQSYESNKIDARETSRNTQEIELTKEQIYQGNLLLVNNDYPVQQESIKSDIIHLSAHDEWAQGYVLLGNEIYLSEDIAHKFSEMVAAAEKDGLQYFAITSGFRSFEEQNNLYQQMGSAYALPAGYSEHNLGLSLDVGSTQMMMAEAPEGKWIEQHAWNYGFILRYPEDKVDITGIQYEPWHIRYVGLPHSAIMKEKNFALEEYVDYLKDEKYITASINGEKYTITYHPISQNKTINVPEHSHFEISGNNMDGVIVTTYE
ncbi:D-alanyl-D-alanine carboxypeptidase [Cytobacillus eiseniae]|uniref:D-alanyl-D-alanine carboxypeptidase n=1 Tax=Cytobacillus eiseniae TaxID=762947 RepID=A0ABS4RIA7_9BACI|nr:VanY-A/VanY-F/VanY-M family D-Ala-D-Ala carboxypeptidase [Cytobacillus eiseniae]MBP2241562.1 D-alanyl-D-alanine carboxypeptidase [Cytobacillus eiseniae]